MMTLLLSFWKVSCQGNSAVIDSSGPDYPSSCMFCFPFSDQMMVLQRTVSFKIMLSYGMCIHIHKNNVCIIYEKTKGKFPDNITWSELGKVIQA